MAKIEVPDGTVHLAVLGKKPDGSGQIVATFQFEQFLSDLDELLGPIDYDIEDGGDAKDPV